MEAKLGFSLFELPHPVLPIVVYIFPLNSDRDSKLPLDLITMQALVRLARRTSLLQARPSFQQGIATRASSAQGEHEGGQESVVDAQASQAGGGESVATELPPPFRVAGFPGAPAPPAGNATTPASSMFD